MDQFIKGWITKAISQRIRIRRLKKRYSQEYMAARISISQNAYSKLERGLTNFTMERMALIAYILDTTVDDLMPAPPEGLPADEEDQ